MSRRLMLLTAVLLLGAALRLHGLDIMRGMVHYDEAYYGVDALSLVAQPRFTPFFPDNFGRESLWMYLLAPSLAVFGGGSFGLRIVAVFTGVLTLAAVYRLALELIGRRVALWSMTALAVLFWHVLASHEAFRALLFPLVGALAFAALWKARRSDWLRFWILSGVLLGLLAYTYLAARLWLALAGVTLIAWLLQPKAKSQWRHGVITGVIALLVALPLIVYMFSHPSAAGERVEQVAVTDLGTLLSSVGVWLRVWFIEGATDVVYNLPGRPLLDLPLAMLFVAGFGVFFASLLGIRKAGSRRGRAFWLILLIGASIAPALLTTDPLKWLRAIGLNTPLALVLGVGAAGIEKAIRHWIERKGVLPGHPYYHAALTIMIPVVLLALAGANTLHDFDRWLNSPDLFIPMEQHIYRGIDWMADNTPADVPVYFSPFSLDHPVLRLREWRLGARPVGAFEAASCFALPDAPQAYYFALTLYDPGFADRLARWAQVEQVFDDAGRDAVYRAEPQHDLFTVREVDFGSMIDARLLSALSDTVATGSTVDVTLGLMARVPVKRDYTLFVHLYEGTALDQGIRLVSQVDQPICPSDPPASWRGDEMILQTYTLPIPSETAAGHYTVAFGIYDSTTVTRLPVGTADYAVIGSIEVK